MSITQRIALVAVFPVLFHGLPASGFPAPRHTQDTLEEAPHLFHDADGGVTAKWVEGGRLRTESFAKGEAIRLPAFQHLLGELDLSSKPEPDPAVWAAPEKMLVVSDVEGCHDDLLLFLARNGVVDQQGNWSYGKGHLVGLGDMVDRGTQVTETLWLFHRLERQARAAGGHVHFVLGNHEAMMMGGDVRYTAPKYRYTAALMGIPCEGLLGADTVIGRWLRTRNCLERIGDFLFVHAGLSLAVAKEELDLEALNARIRAHLGAPPLQVPDLETRELIWGRIGPLWYRGYFELHALDFGPVPTLLELDLILERSGAERIVVGHTKVAQVTPMFGGRVIALDIPWTHPQDVRGLLVQGGTVRLVDIEGEQTPFLD